jgi:hypothetical protein
VGDDKEIEFYAPDVYLFGPAADGSWAANDAWKFSVPADATGSFVSPAFSADASTGDGGVRICIVLPNTDWWKTEFIVLDGKIAYRGNGGDQTRVAGTAGQTVSLNFATGTGSIQ